MKMNVCNYNKLINGQSISISEVKSIYQELLDEESLLAAEILHTIETNDYVKLTHLLTNRSKIQVAIKEIESLHGKDLINYKSHKERVSSTLEQYAESLSSFGMVQRLDDLNESAHNMLTKTFNLSSKVLSTSNKLNQKLGNHLLKKAVRGISKVSVAMTKKQ